MSKNLEGIVDGGVQTDAIEKVDRPKMWRGKHKSSRIGQMVQSLRSGVPAVLADARYERFDRKEWAASHRRNLRPYRCDLFATPGGYRALEMIDAWAQVRLVRRDTGDNTAMPAGDGLKGAIGEGFSIPEAAMKFMSIEAWLNSEPDWVRRLMEFVWVNGWTIVATKVAYWLPNPAKEREMTQIHAAIRELERKTQDQAVTDEVRGLRDQIQEIIEGMMVVLLATDPEPPSARADYTLHVRRWTFDFTQFPWPEVDESEEMTPAIRARILEREATLAVLRAAIRFDLGSTFTASIPVE